MYLLTSEPSEIVLASVRMTEQLRNNSMPSHDISQRHELSSGDTIWIQRIGMKYIAVKLPPAWLSTPEHSPEGSKRQAMNWIIQWLSEDVLEVD